MSIIFFHVIIFCLDFLQKKNRFLLPQMWCNSNDIEITFYWLRPSMFTNHLFVLVKIHQRSSNDGKIQKKSTSRRSRTWEGNKKNKQEKFLISREKNKKLLRREDILMFFYCHFSIYTVIFFNGWNKMLKENKKQSSSFSINMHSAYWRLCSLSGWRSYSNNNNKKKRHNNMWKMQMKSGKRK